MASSVSATNSRLSVDDWVQEGFRVLAEDGVKALTLGHLCTRLGVTKGSFYWHFSDCHHSVLERLNVSHG